ncbi:MAG: hypothetical protein HYZ53_03725 [Planctomycetes bacterium]|nr:hypothetical protein [Planctomycetota bacterium]
MQLPLFPDAFDVETEALEALAALDVGRAARRLDRARALDPHLPNLEVLAEVVGYLHPILGAGQPTEERLAEVFLALPEACREGRLTSAAACRVDRVLARYALRSWDERRPFHDGQGRLPYGALLLVDADAPERARDSLRLACAAAAVAAVGERARVWGYLGDACLLVERTDEANAAYVRALALDPWSVDLHRTKADRLRRILERLTAERPFEEAVGELLAHAWVEGVVRIEARNDWLEDERERLRRSGPDGGRSEAAWRGRRFSLLLFLDRSLPVGRADRAARKEMQALDAGLFKRFVRRLQELEERER